VNHPAWSYLIAAVVGYMLGSCPTGFIVSRAYGIDIRKHGSGNIGATNVLRVLGKKVGYLVFALDAAKGLVAVTLAYFIAHTLQPNFTHLGLIGIAAGVACVLGHTFPVWLGFRGGKGVATSAGVLLGLMPIAVGSVFVVWLLLFQITRYVSVASIGAAISLPIFVLLYLHFRMLTGVSLLPFSILIAAVVIWRHRSNMQRLFQGKEQRFDQE